MWLARLSSCHLLKLPVAQEATSHHTGSEFNDRYLVRSEFFKFCGGKPSVSLDRSFYVKPLNNFTEAVNMGLTSEKSALIFSS